MEGRVKYINVEKRYGFVCGQDGEDYFFHFSKSKDGIEPHKGVLLSFDIETTEKGKNAVNFEVLAEDNKAKPSFIMIGNNRIRISNIKEYSISKEEYLTGKILEESTASELQTEKEEDNRYIYRDKFYTWKGRRYLMKDGDYLYCHWIRPSTDSYQINTKLLVNYAGFTHVYLIDRNDTMIAFDVEQDKKKVLYDKEEMRLCEQMFLDTLHITTFQDDDFFWIAEQPAEYELFDLGCADIYNKLAELDSYCIG